MTINMFLNHQVLEPNIIFVHSFILSSILLGGCSSENNALSRFSSYFNMQVLSYTSGMISELRYFFEFALAANWTQYHIGKQELWLHFPLDSNSHSQTQ